MKASMPYIVTTIYLCYRFQGLHSKIPLYNNVPKSTVYPCLCIGPLKMQHLTLGQIKCNLPFHCPNFELVYFPLYPLTIFLIIHNSTNIYVICKFTIQTTYIFIQLYHKQKIQKWSLWNNTGHRPPVRITLHHHHYPLHSMAKPSLKKIYLISMYPLCFYLLDQTTMKEFVKSPFDWMSLWCSNGHAIEWVES